MSQLQQEVEGLKHERNVLQKICAQRADALEKIGLRSDCTLDEVDDWMAGHVRVPVEMIRRAMYAIEHFAYDTVAGRNSAHELHELLSAAKEKGK